jgi:hypothetical protein
LPTRYNLRWQIRPPINATVTDVSDPTSLVVDSVFSLSVPIPKKLQSSIRQTSLEAEDPDHSTGPSTSINMPWIVVEYVKYLNGSSITRDVHQTHMAGALEVVLSFYESFNLKLPVYGFLIDEVDIWVYVATISEVSELLSRKSASNVLSARVRRRS